MRRIHVLVSRFNWPHATWKGRPPEEYQAWLRERLELLDRYTVPSVRNCYVKPDLWLMLVDDREQWIVAPLEDLLARAACPYRLAPYRGRPIRDTVREALEGELFPAAVWMTRLDTDDLVASDFFARLRAVDLSEADLRDGVCASFPGGANYDAAEDRFYFSAYPGSPFVTYAEYAEQPGDLKTVFMAMHEQLPDTSGRHVGLRSYHPMWASVIHLTNLQNQSLRATNQFEVGPREALKLKFGLR